MKDISCLPGSSKSRPEAMDMGKEVVFQPIGRRVVADPEKTILDLAMACGVDIQSACGGKGLCGKCRVRPGGRVSEPSVHETDLLKHGNDGDRLACQTQLLQGGTVWVPEQSRTLKPVILTRGLSTELQMDPMLRTHEFKITPPSPEDPKALEDLLLEKFGQEANPYHLPLSVFQNLPPIFMDKKGCLTAVTRYENEILDIAPGHGRHCIGLAVDLGTTTVVAYLFDLKNGRPLAVEAEMNPQVKYGDDVISRIGFCLKTPQGKSALSAQIRDCIDKLAAKACKTANVSSRRIMDCVMVGNTAMHHLFLELDPVFLSQAPYMPVTKKAIDLKARDVGLSFAPEAWIHWLPVKAGFVGADTISVALAVRADKVTRPTLILDLGTNGEMILAVPGRMVCCSTAAGPAFEGGHITYGMRAGPGAVEQVVLDPISHACKLTVIGNVKPIGLCGSGLVSLISQLAVAGFITPGGSFNTQMMGSHLRASSDGLEYVVVFADQCDFDYDLVLTSQDVSEIQLAKGAIRAGVEIMMQELGVTKLGEVLLAGAFGNYLDPQSAQQLGLFPLPDQNRVLGVGNAAGTGAIMALISSKDRNHADVLSLNMQYLELTTHPDFQELFVDCMAFNDQD
ncbi:MAG: DUF4445 domain-containing protein [Desulfobacula sp.]|uniref:ASKHA domain-containing protein n=1 Tax=Desulfobacula sp. TaxID=2593537 RepID=UPI001D58084F|nr:DUF4445 domain-containing protein [Desulfobacula sp.]MBT3484369.1 DUF4445 domain-containing protein [Desulfobacula sp.]MBT3806701.1 DUF4445 domain-containing protein [Desulfobacula sp.]MBT4024178.1 DUF4445 domain-containing protein [Desulfobacula sp.]MBT4197407.1 DUF4445 domain-containing protein [Desulfobacula sp.]